MPSDPISLIGSSITAIQAQLTTSSRNTAESSTRGGLLQTVEIQSLGDLGVVAATPRVFLNQQLVKNLQNENGNNAYWQVVSDNYTQFMENFGTKGTIQSLDKKLGEISAEILKLNADVTPTQKQSAITVIQQKLFEFTLIQESISNMRVQIDQQKNQLINTDVPNLLTTLAQLNTPKPTAEDIQNINTAQFDLAQQLGPLVFEMGKGTEAGFFSVKINNVTTGQGQKLLERNTINFLNYVSTPNPQPGVPLNSATANGIPIDASVSSGILGGLNAADKTLCNIQTALDNFAKTLVLNLNQIHNQGTGTQQPSTLQGMVGYFGTEGTPINTNDTISGTGTLRIAIVDPTNNNQIVDYIDTALQANESIASLFNRINTGMYALNSGTTFNISVNANGVPEIVCSNPNLGLSIGHSGPNVAMISTGANYNAAAATNFSGFFHFNDLIVYSTPSVSTPGLFGSLSVRPDIVATPNRLSGCDLDYTTPLSAGSYVIVDKPSIDRNMFDAIYVNFSTPQAFATAGDIIAINTSIQNYGATIINYYAKQKTSSDSYFSSSTTNLQNYQATFQAQSGIDPDAEKIRNIQIARSYNISMSVMRMLLKLDQVDLKLLDL